VRGAQQDGETAEDWTNEKISFSTMFFWLHCLQFPQGRLASFAFRVLLFSFFLSSFDNVPFLLTDAFSGCLSADVGHLHRLTLRG
jgi:hypothetical protein